MALVEEEDDSFEKLLEEKRHNEMIQVLTKILVKLEAEPMTETLEKSLKSIAERPVDNTTITEAISAISKVIVKKIDELKIVYKAKAEAKECEFTVHYGKDDKIDFVTVKGK